MGAVTLLAVVWFPESERTTATAIAQAANGIGSTIGFLNPVLLAPTAADIPKIFYVGLTVSILTLCCFALDVPARPRQPPSAAAALLAHHERMSPNRGRQLCRPRRK